MKRLAIIGLAAALLAVGAARAQTPPRYDAVQLPGRAASVDAKGAVLFAVETTSGELKPGWYRRHANGGIERLEGLEPTDWLSALNPAGTIVGTRPIGPLCASTNGWVKDGKLYCHNHAFVWRNGKLRDLGTLDGLHTTLVAVNSAEVAIGVFSHNSSDGSQCGPDWGDQSVMEGLIYQGGQLSRKQLPGAVCVDFSDINDAGDIIGQVSDGREWHGVLLRDGGVTRLDNFSPNAINNSGEIVGVMKDGSGPAIYRRGSFERISGAAKGSWADDINDAGTVVGAAKFKMDGPLTAFVSHQGRAVDLNALVDWKKTQFVNGKPPVLNWAFRIAPRGEILVRAEGKQNTTYLLIPKPDGIAAAVRPGAVFVYSVGRGGPDAMAVGSGNAESTLVYRLTKADAQGLRFDFSLAAAVPLKGTQTVAAADAQSAQTVRTARAKGDISQLGALALPRVSDDVYAQLKAGKPSFLTFDGEGPGAIAPDGGEDVPLSLNDRPVKVRALRARGADGCRVWIADDRAFPMLLRHNCGAVAFTATGVYDPARVAQDLLARLEATATAATGTILFAFNSAALQTESLPILDAIAARIKQQPSLRLIVEGHTDSIGSASANEALSLSRAKVVQAYLADTAGVDPSRIVAKGLGASQPVADNGTPEGRAANRRCVLRMAAGRSLTKHQAP